MNPIVQQVLDHQLTTGKRVALKFYHWQSLDKVEEVMVAPAMLRLMSLVDAEIFKAGVCSLLKGPSE